MHLCVLALLCGLMFACECFVVFVGSMFNKVINKEVAMCVCVCVCVFVCLFVFVGLCVGVCVWVWVRSARDKIQWETCIKRKIKIIILR